MAAVTGGFTPLSLFASGEAGVWYDPSDLSTLFQNAAGTTPVTAVEQPVGLILDKSKGLAIGSEIASSLNVTTDWSYSSGTLTGLGTAGGGTATSTNASVANTWYKITYTKTGTSGLFQVRVGNTFVVTDGGAGTASRTYYAMAANTAGLIFTNSGSYAGTVSGISCVAIAGNHASQSTTTARPVLSARVNLLTYTEQFDNAAWTLTGTTIGANELISPDGATTADNWRINSGIAITTSALGLFTSGITARFRATAATALGAVPYTYVLHVKAGSGISHIQLRVATAIDLTGTSYGTIVKLSDGAVATSDGTTTVTSIGNGWFRVAFTFTPTAASYYTGAWAWNDTSKTANGTEYISIWGADLRPSNAGVSLPAYQRIAAATDYDTTGFPLYLRFDGTDDSLATGTINPGSVDKAQVFAGVRKLSDAVQATIIELSPSSAGNNGVFWLQGPSSSSVDNYYWRSKGSLSSDVNATGFAAPDTKVITGIGDISGDNSAIRINGLQSKQSTSDQGTGNYGSYPLYIGRRGGTSFPFNGHIYSLIVRFGPNLTTPQITNAETWVNSKTGAY